MGACKSKKESPPSYIAVTQNDHDSEETKSDRPKSGSDTAEPSLNPRERLKEAKCKNDEFPRLDHTLEVRCMEMLVAVEQQYGTEFIQNNVIDVLAYVEKYRVDMQQAFRCRGSPYRYEASDKARTVLHAIYTRLQ